MEIILRKLGFEVKLVIKINILFEKAFNGSEALELVKREEKCSS